MSAVEPTDLAGFDGAREQIHGGGLGGAGLGRDLLAPTTLGQFQIQLQVVDAPECLSLVCRRLGGEPLVGGQALEGGL